MTRTILLAVTLLAPFWAACAPAGDGGEPGSPDDRGPPTPEQVIAWEAAAPGVGLARYCLAVNVLCCWRPRRIAYCHRPGAVI